jgi:putative copper export protein
MNTLVRRAFARPRTLLFVAMNALLLSAPVLAQTGGGTSGGTSGGGVDVNVGTTTTHTSTEWFGQWWLWAVGLAVFLIIIVALTNRGGRTNP